MFKFTGIQILPVVLTLCQWLSSYLVRTPSCSAGVRKIEPLASRQPHWEQIWTKPRVCTKVYKNSIQKMNKGLGKSIRTYFVIDRTCWISHSVPLLCMYYYIII